MITPNVKRANYVAQGQPELIAPQDGGKTFKPFYLVSVINDRDTSDQKELRISAKLYERAGLDQITPSKWNNVQNPVVLSATVEERIAGVTGYKDDKGVEVTHTSSGFSVQSVSVGVRSLTLEEQLRYGLFGRAQAVDLFKAEPVATEEGETSSKAKAK